MAVLRNAGRGTMKPVRAKGVLLSGVALMAVVQAAANFREPLRDRDQRAALRSSDLTMRLVVYGAPN